MAAKVTSKNISWRQNLENEPNKKYNFDYYYGQNKICNQYITWKTTQLYKHNWIKT